MLDAGAHDAFYCPAMVRLIGAPPAFPEDPTENLEIVVEEGLTGPKGEKGDKGDKGDQGHPGAPGGASFPHHQTSPAATWPVTHGLGRRIYPLVLLDSDPTAPAWPGATIVDANQTIIEFDEPQTGWAYF
jgi:hypothetical protein